MKKMKKIMCLMLAVVLVLGMSMTVFAANEVPNSKADLSGHTYKAYQIFSGTQAEGDNTGKLASIAWGTGVNGNTLLAALKADDTSFKDDTGKNVFADAKTAADVAAAMDGWADYDALSAAFAKHVNNNLTGTGTTVVNGQTELDPGYYLVVDETAFEKGDENTVYNLSLLQLTQKGTFDIKNKTDIPTVEKKVKETNDTTGAVTDWQDAADYDIRDEIPFQITGTLPANYADYTTYKYVFHDEFSEGLTVNKEDVKVTADDTVVTDKFTITVEAGKLTVSIDNLKDITGLVGGSTIVVDYKATLNEKAVKGGAGNTNEVYLEYSNNPNKGGEGNTPKDKVTVFTFDIEANKVNNKGVALKGAGFTLYKKVNGVAENDGWVKIGNEIKGEDLTTFTFERVDSGKYKLVETTVPEGYNKADDIEFEVKAVYDTKADDPDLTDLGVYDNEGNLLSDSTGDKAVFTASVDDGKVSTDVINNSGSTLPETGGIGTTIFYVLGGIIVLGCGVVLIAKKRVSKES